MGYSSSGNTVWTIVLSFGAEFAAFLFKNGYLKDYVFIGVTNSSDGRTDSFSFMLSLLIFLLLLALYAISLLLMIVES